MCAPKGRDLSSNFTTTDDVTVTRKDSRRKHGTFGMYALGSRFHIAFLFGSINFRRQHTRMGALIVGVVLEIYVHPSHSLALYFAEKNINLDCILAQDRATPEGSKGLPEKRPTL